MGLGLLQLVLGCEQVGLECRCPILNDALEFGDLGLLVGRDLVALCSRSVTRALRPDLGLEFVGFYLLILIFSGQRIMFWTVVE